MSNVKKLPFTFSYDIFLNGLYQRGKKHICTKKLQIQWLKQVVEKSASNTNKVPYILKNNTVRLPFSDENVWTFNISKIVVSSHETLFHLWVKTKIVMFIYDDIQDTGGRQTKHNTNISCLL